MSSPTTNTGVYLAGPDGFTPAMLHWHRSVLMPAVVAAGLTPVSPWEGAEQIGEEFAAIEAMTPGPERVGAFVAMDYRVGEKNAELIGSCAAMLAVLDGVDVDSGTASEIGFGSALGLKIVGVRTDIRKSSENDGTQVNLQVEYFITRTGGHVHRSHLDAIDEVARLLL